MGKRYSIVYATIFSIIVFWLLIPLFLFLTSLLIDKYFELFWNFNPLRISIGVILIILGIYLALWATNTVYFMGKGLPLFFYPPKYLVKSGPYSFIRHPLYIAFFIYISGLGLILSPSMIYIVNPLFLIFIILYTIREEKFLLKKFGSEYSDYKNSVPAVIPFKKRIINTPNMVSPVIIFLYLVISALNRMIFGLKLEGKINRDIGPYIILSNHQSYFDPLFIVSAICMPVRFITTGKMFENPLLKMFFLSLSCIPVKRGSGIKSIIRTKEALKNGDIIGIFPEASRSWDGYFVSLDRRVIKFIKNLGYPIVFLRIDGAHNVLPRWSKVIHRANVTVKVTGEIENPENLSVKEIQSKIEECLSGSKRSSARWGSFNKYIERLLWICPLCGFSNGVKRKGRRNFYCDRCNNKWYIDEKMKIIPSLYRKMKERILRKGINLPVKIKKGITVYKDMIRIGKKSIPIDEITFLALEGVNFIQIGIKGKSSIGIKTYDALKLKVCIEVLRGVKENIDRDPFRF